MRHNDMMYSKETELAVIENYLRILLGRAEQSGQRNEVLHRIEAALGQVIKDSGLTEEYRAEVERRHQSSLNLLL